MDCVIVQIKKLRKNSYRKLISNNSVFETINEKDIDFITYCTNHKLDEDSWFIIEKFSEQDFFLDILREKFNSKDYEDMVKKQFTDIKLFISVQGSDFYFQKVTPSNFIRQKAFVFGEVAKIQEDSTRLVIKQLPDAIYFKNSDILAFKNLATISSIFNGIDVLYKEATQEEVEDFFNESFVQLGSDYNIEDVSKPNRKLISFALEALDSFSPNDRDKVFDYIDSYCNNQLTYDKKAKIFEINSNIDLKNLIYGLQERFYTTSLGKEKRLANSIKVMT